MTQSLDRFLAKLGYWLMVFLLVGGVPVDAATAWLSYRHGGGFDRLSLIWRGVFLLGIVVVLVLRWRKRWKWYLVFVVSSIISSFSLFVGYFISPLFNLGLYMQTVDDMIKYTSMFFFYLLVKESARADSAFKRLATVVDWVIASYSLAILAGMILNIDFMRSYGEYRPGFKGIIYATNETSGFMLVSLAWVAVRVGLGARPWWLAAMVFAAGFVVGTKALLIGMPVLIIPMVYIFRTKRQATMLILAGLALGSLGFLAEFLYNPHFRLAINLFIDYFNFARSAFTQDSLLNALSSGRDLKIRTVVTTVITQNPFGLLIGGFPTGAAMTESDPIDLALTFGFPFLLVYLAAFIQLAFNGQKYLPPRARRAKIAFLIAWFTIAFTAGHLWISGICAPFVAIFFAYLNRQNNLASGSEPELNSDSASFTS